MIQWTYHSAGFGMQVEHPGFEVIVAEDMSEPGQLNPLLLATPVCARLSFLSQWPVSPEPER
ncbi:MAG TPA: hypothetical protein VFE51_15385 [Verrucomicrobiae bacterium]|nr:hypothetical protein [Verrucomicrobiae bacterium]